MRPITVRAASETPDAVLDVAVAQLAELRTLADVLEWARRHSPPLRVLEIITQDEYTHDIVLPFDGSHFLSFDAT